MYVDIDEFDVNKMEICGKMDTGNNIKYFNIKYRYGNDIVDELNIYVNNIRISDKRINESLKYNTLPVDYKNGNYNNFRNIVILIKKIIIEYYRNNIKNINIDENNINKILTKNNLSLLYHNKICDIIKLGFKNENYVNTKISNIIQLNSILGDKRYNNIYKNRYYRCNLIFSINSCIIKKENDIFDFSIKPCIRKLELCFNKAKTISTINRKEKIIIMDDLFHVINV